MNWTQHHHNHFAGRPVLVTGGAGFIGSHIVEALVQLDAKVTVIDDLSGGDWANLNGFGDNVKQITASILDESAIADAASGCDYIFHQAGLGSVPASVEMPVRYHEVNVMGTIAVLEAARNAKVQRVVYAGSSSAYGNPPSGDSPKVETQAPDPLSPYAVAKLAGEYALKAYSATYGLDTAITRYFNIFGPRQNANSAYAAVIAAFAKALLTNTDAIIYGDGEQSRDFTFVHNAVHANLLAARAQVPLHGAVFNVACAKRITVNQLFTEIANLLGHADAKPIYKPERGRRRQTLTRQYLRRSKNPWLRTPRRSRSRPRPHTRLVQANHHRIVRQSIPRIKTAAIPSGSRLVSLRPPPHPSVSPPREILFTTPSHPESSPGHWLSALSSDQKSPTTASAPMHSPGHTRSTPLRHTL